MNKKNLRSYLFRHLDGIALFMPISILKESGILDFIKNNEKFNIQDIIKKFNCNAGYLNVTLRLLASQGWLKYKIIKDGSSIDYDLTKKGHICIQLAHLYKIYSCHIDTLIDIDKLIFSNFSQHKEKDLNILIDTLVSFSKKNKLHTIEWEVSKHLEGILIGPILVALGMSRAHSIIFSNKQSFNINTLSEEIPSLIIIMKFFKYLGWINESNGNFKFTDEGDFFIKRSTAYGVTVSYLPMFKNTKELLLGNPAILWENKKDPIEKEIHVNRRMNVWGSGGAHSLYFHTIDEIIIDLFNKPIDKQPIGIADMGCGDGTMLKHLYNVVKSRTKRGENLKKYPLIIIGADYNKAARIASSITLNEADIKHIILSGDISKPNNFANDLLQKYNLHLNDMLNVRSFLDHNRIYKTPTKKYSQISCDSTGAFAFRGQWIPNNELKQNLIEHFLSWSKYIKKFGLLMLELHTINPSMCAKNLGSNIATAYDGTHGYSDQYIVEADSMLEAASEAGLNPVKKYSTRFPSKEITTISINLFK